VNGSGNLFTEPNGMSLRPKGDKQKSLVMEQDDKVKVFFSFQPAVGAWAHWPLFYAVKNPISLDSLNSELSAFLKSLQCLSKQEFLALYDEDDEDESEAIDN
jgi:hypothetical protein